MKKVLPVGVILVAIIAIVLFSPLFKIREIVVSAENGCNVDKNDKNLSQFIGKNIFYINRPNIQNDLKKTFPCIENVSLEKKIPNKLLLKITSKKAVVNIDGTSFQATADGLVIEAKNSDKRPQLFLPQNTPVVLGQKLQDPTTLSSLAISARLVKTDFVPTNIRIVDNTDIAVYSSTEAVVLFSSLGDPNVQVDSLQALLAGAKIDPSKIAKIDLRFEKPVVTYKQ